jgi:hypothetical protein
MNYDTLIEKLKYYGVNKRGIDCIKYFLHNRKQRADINVNSVKNPS